MNRFICVHGHFYQPPRENPWLEAIEVQDSAYPFHDWNERVTAECYGPNGSSRILNDAGKIRDIVNNYGWISYDVGPTLLAWLEAEAPEAYAAIIVADSLSREHLGGRGSAMAQVYNHLIMPLANSRDKETQVIWGVRDFQHRFGRDPESMWLAETAVDLESLDLMASHGIAFTVLAPEQAARVRPIEGGDWQDVTGSKVDPTHPYLVKTPSGGEIVVFFYDGPVSQAVAFEGLLNRGETFAGRLLDIFAEGRDWEQIAHIATDGETYGHHHRHGEMALSYALHYIDEKQLAGLTNYSTYLESHDVEWEAEIIENTSWSCVHGVERWRSDCGCHTGGHAGWNQAWRTPLRDALDWLRDELVQIYEEKASALLKDPWAARNAYIDVILDRSDESVNRFFAEQATHELNTDERVEALKWLELQRHAMLMYTSCGWFFNELSGIETVQVMQYAGRAIHLAEDLNGGDIEEQFLERLEQAKSNIPAQGNGRDIYRRYVDPARVDLPKVAAHYAMSALIEDEAPNSTFCFDVERLAFDVFESGRPKLAIGQLRIVSRITEEHGVFSFAALHLGDHNIDAGVRDIGTPEQYQQMHDEIRAAFDVADFPEVIRLIDRHFGDHSYSLGSLFRDKQREITEEILEITLEEAEAVYRNLYENHEALLRYLDDVGVPLPSALRTAAQFVMNADIERAFFEDPIDTEYVTNYFASTRDWGLELDIAKMGFVLEQRVDEIAAKLLEPESQGAAPAELLSALVMIDSLPFDIQYWEAQNHYFQAMRDSLPAMRAAAERGDTAAKAWVAAFEEIGDRLSVQVA